MQVKETKLHSTAADRNKVPILKVLRSELPKDGLVFELASGSGQHVIFFAKHFPDLHWQPSEIDERSLKSIHQYRKDSGLRNVLSPLKVDVSGRWPEIKINAILSINLIHITDPENIFRLFKSAGEKLAREEKLITYGPYRICDGINPPSNIEFEKVLKKMNAQFRLWEIEELSKLGVENGFDKVKIIDMPNFNHCIVFRKK